MSDAQSSQIIAIGGGGFSTQQGASAMEPDNLALDRYVLRVAQARRPRPRVCFLPTATDNVDSYLLKFYQACSRLDCLPSHLSLFSLPTADLESYVLEKDVIYVGGGNTRSLLALWREWGLDAIFRRAYESGIVLAGVSSGANCWFQECTTDSVPGELRVLAGLGLLAGSFTPHYDSEPARRPALHRLLQAAAIRPGFAVCDGAALHFVDGELLRAVRSTPAARAYRVSCQGGEVVEEEVEMGEA